MPKEKMSKKISKKINVEEKNVEGKNIERKKYRMTKNIESMKNVVTWKKYKIYILFHWKKGTIRSLIRTNGYNKNKSFDRSR